MMTAPRITAIAISMVSAAGCATQPSSPAPEKSAYLSAEFKKVNVAVNQCEASRNYDPEAAKELSPYSVPANELAARRCIYEAIRTIMVPASRNPGLYTRLIDRDRALTRSVQQRRITRAQRQDQIEAMIAEIRWGEGAIRRSKTSSLSQRDIGLQRQTVQFLFSLR
jgi:hypothetical protein